MFKLACVAVAMVLGFGGLVAANGPKGSEEPKDEPKLVRPGLEAAKVPGVPRKEADFKCANTGTLSAVVRYLDAFSLADPKISDVAAVPFYVENRALIEKLEDLEPQLKGIFTKHKGRKSTESVIADLRIVPAGATIEEAEIWLGIKLRNRGNYTKLFEHAVRERADFVEVFPVRDSKGGKYEEGETPKNRGEPVYFAVKQQGSSEKARIIGVAG